MRRTAWTRHLSPPVAPRRKRPPRLAARPRMRIAPPRSFPIRHQPGRTHGHSGSGSAGPPVPPPGGRAQRV